MSLTGSLELAPATPGDVPVAGVARSLCESLIQTVREPLLVLDADYRVVFANASFVEGIAAGDPPSAGCELSKLCGGLLDLPELRSLLDETHANGSAFENFELTVRGDRARVFLVNGRMVEECLGEPLILLSLDDATVRLHAVEVADESTQVLEGDMLTRTAELEHAVAELEAFSYSVSHDLRAPLRTIDGFSRILLSDHGDGLSPEILRYLGLIRTGADQMGQLIDGLLSFSRLGRQSLTLRPVELRRVVDEVLAGYEDEIAERGIVVEIDELPVVQADLLLIRQVLVNLIDNAFKYTRRAEQPRIEIGTELVSGEQALFVRDNGIGFDPAFAGNLFGVFHRLNRAEDFEGTGVGLALTRRIVERHGGAIWAEAEDGAGATFHFTLGGTDA
ncbi:MAG TPA: ATP-binding protein [Gaiellaceae bacterium]|nr:ATP-binding protein [Gaiellaceae bacterium]